MYWWGNMSLQPEALCQADKGALHLLYLLVCGRTCVSQRTQLWHNPLEDIHIIIFPYVCPFSFTTASAAVFVCLQELRCLSIMSQSCSVILGQSLSGKQNTPGKVCVGECMFVSLLNSNSEFRCRDTMSNFEPWETFHCLLWKSALCTIWTIFDGGWCSRTENTKIMSSVLWEFKPHNVVLHTWF